jgi:hypothetical protein
MKHFIVRLSIALALFCCAVNSHAQFADVTGGSLSVTIATPLASLLSSHNVAAAAFTPAPYDNQIPYLGVTSGVFNLLDGRGSFAAQGEFDITNATTTLQVMNLNFETVDCTAVITGTVFVNNNYVAHVILFNITKENPWGAPLKPGFVSLKNIPARLSPAMAKIISVFFGVTVPTDMQAAEINISTGFSAI